jgi:riboflavin synthase
MFTGIIEAVGVITRIDNQGEDISLHVNTGKLDRTDVKLGDSIATNGVCLTVVKLLEQGFRADLSRETLQRTAFADCSVGDAVNLEKAVTPNTRLGGHIVSGHVDGLGEVVSVHQIGRAWEYWVRAPAGLAKYIAEKGSICVDGISLTINQVNGAEFKLTIVPHTSSETTIDSFKPGRRVNLEVDVIARYLERLMLSDKAAGSASQTSDEKMTELLARSGLLK